MPTVAPSSPLAGLVVALGFLATVALFVVFVAGATSLHASDAAGNALSQAFTVLAGVALWVALLLLALLAALRGLLPPAALAASALLLPASGAAALAVVQLLSRDRSQGRWLLAVPVVAPLLVLGYLLWAGLPALRARVPASLADLVAGGGLLLVSLLPWPSVWLAGRAASQQTERLGRETEARERRERAEEQREWSERLDELPPDAPLWEWREFTEHGPELRQRALAGVRKLDRRQADAELMLSRGLDFPMRELPELDLQASPALCAGARRLLGDKLRQISPAVPGRPWSWEQAAVDPYLPALAWLLAHGCDCRAELAALESALQAYPRDADRERTERALAGLHGRP